MHQTKRNGKGTFCQYPRKFKKNLVGKENSVIQQPNRDKNCLRHDKKNNLCLKFA